MQHSCHYLLYYLSFSHFCVKVLKFSLGVIKVTEFNNVNEIYRQPTLVAKAMKIWEFWQKIGHNSDNITDRDKTVSPGQAI